MTETNPILKNIRESAGMRLAVLFGSFFFLLIISSVIGEGLNSLKIGDARTHILLGSVVQCFLAFCLPAYLLGRYCSNNWKTWLKLSTPPQMKALAGVVVVYIISMPFMEWLVEWNANIQFPESLSSLETLFKEWEKTGEDTTKILLETHGWVAVTAGVIVIGVITGFSEELFFRGGVQGIFTQSNMGKHAAIWLAAIIFSTMHFQFFGFFPRLLMGVFFGYLLVWSGSIWVPVFAHVLNNSLVVLTAALSGGESTSILETGNADIFLGSGITVVVSAALTILFFIFFKDSIFKRQKTDHLLWQKNQQPPISEE